MSLLGDKVSFVSLGLSCQISHNLRRKASDLALMAEDETMSISAMYFDYIIAHRDTLLRFLQADFSTFEHPSEIVIDSNSPYWPREKIWFVHNFKEGGMSTGGIDIEGDFNRSLYKVRHLLKKFSELDQRQEKIVFVTGNPQSTLRQYGSGDAFRKSAFSFDGKYASKLSQALFDRFGDRFAGLLVVENEQTFSGDWNADFVTRGLVRSAPVWTGDDESWDAMLSKTVPKIFERQ